MRKLAILASGAALLVAACSDSSDADGAGAASGMTTPEMAAADMPELEAGQYRATITMTGIDVPGLPPEMAGHGAGLTTTNEYCLSQADVAGGFEEMMKRGQDGDCQYERFNAAGGKLDAVMLCKTPQGDARMEMKGTATATGSEFDAEMAMDLDGKGNGIMRFNAKHERIGDCS
ncbi:MAG: DUF3617 domain-containing protein [Erythrobacter sp.]